MRIAANIADLTRYDEIPRQCLIAPVVGQKQIIDAEVGRMDGAAVVLECDEPRARAIVSLLRSCTMPRQSGMQSVHTVRGRAVGGGRYENARTAGDVSPDLLGVGAQARRQVLPRHRYGRRARSHDAIRVDGTCLSERPGGSAGRGAPQ